MQGKTTSEQPPYNELYSRIMDYCEALQWSDADLAREAGVWQSKLTDLTWGRKQSLGKKNLLKIAGALGISVDKLIGDPPVDDLEPPLDTWVLSTMEQNLIRCWRECSDKEKESIAFLLRDYGMPLPERKVELSQSGLVG